MSYTLPKGQKPAELKKIAVKIVGFRVGVDRAVFYRKLHTPNDKDFGRYMNIAFHEKNCDFVSVRKVALEKGQ